MTARKKIADSLWLNIPADDDEAKAIAAQMLDAYAAEVRAHERRENAAELAALLSEYEAGYVKEPTLAFRLAELHRRWQRQGAEGGEGR